MKTVVPLHIQSGMSQSGSYILILLEPQSGIQVPIFIGAHEAQGILLAKETVATRRPLTHRLMLQVLDAYGMILKEVTIDRVEEGIFYSTLHISDGFSLKHFDSRTSDAITLALLCGCPIKADETVLAETGIMPADAKPEVPEPSLEDLERELHECEESEEYERAAEIQKKIHQLKSNEQ